MKKWKKYGRVRFDAAAFAEFDAAISVAPKATKDYHLTVGRSSEEWTFDTLPEFLAAADSANDSSFFAETGKTRIEIFTDESSGRVSVKAPTREEIEKIFSTIEKHAERCRLPEPEEREEAEESGTGKVFIGHGHSQQWRDLKDHLHEKHGYDVEHYEMGSRAGHTIRDILEEMMGSSSVALLVMTGEDETKDGALNPRLNVVHEAGLFQGRLGFTRTIILLEEGATEFSNVHGIDQIRFPKGKIRETFGDVLAFLKRELGQIPK